MVGRGRATLVENKKRWLGYILVILRASFWGIAGTTSQKLFQDFHITVDWLVTIRLLVSGVLLLILSMFLNKGKSIFSIWKNKRSAIQMIIFSLVGMTTVQYTYMASIHEGNAAVATLLQYLGPAFILIYLVLTKKDRLLLKNTTAVLLALIGTFLLLTNGSFESLQVPSSAVVWGILSGVALAFYTLYPVKLLQENHPTVIVGWAMLIAGIGMSFIEPPWAVDISNWTGETFVYLTIVIIFGTMLSFWFYLSSLKYLTPQVTSLLANMEPLTSIISSVIWLKMSFGIFQLVGMFLIIFMVILLTAVKDKSENRKSEVSVLDVNENQI